VRLFASANSWIQGEAVHQLYAAARLEAVRLAVGFPDLQPGKGSPVGAAFVTEGVIYPHLIGGDIGCGMGLFKTNLLQRDLKLSLWTDLRFDLEHPWEADVGKVLAAAELESTEVDESLGTIGSGNHFADGWHGLLAADGLGPPQRGPGLGLRDLHGQRNLGRQHPPDTGPASVSRGLRRRRQGRRRWHDLRIQMSRWPSSPGSGLQNRAGECDPHTGLHFTFPSIGVERYTLMAVRKDLTSRNTGRDTLMLDHFKPLIRA